MTTAPSARFKLYPAYKDSGVEWLGKIPVRSGPGSVRLAPESAMEYIWTRFTGARSKSGNA